MQLWAAARFIANNFSRYNDITHISAYTHYRKHHACGGSFSGERASISHTMVKDPNNLQLHGPTFMKQISLTNSDTLKCHNPCNTTPLRVHRSIQHTRCDTLPCNRVHHTPASASHRCRPRVHILHKCRSDRHHLYPLSTFAGLVAP